MITPSNHPKKSFTLGFTIGFPWVSHGFPQPTALDAYVSCTKVLGLHKDSGTQSTLLQEIGVQHSWTSGKSPRIDIDIEI
jgi:hypothetical protein